MQTHYGRSLKHRGWVNVLQVVRLIFFFNALGGVGSATCVLLSEPSSLPDASKKEQRDRDG